MELALIADDDTVHSVVEELDDDDLKPSGWLELLEEVKDMVEDLEREGRHEDQGA